MKKQVHAIFIFIGVVLLATAFLQGKVVDGTNSVISQIEDTGVGLSDYGVATALLAMRVEEGVDNPFGLEEDPVEQEYIFPEIPSEPVEPLSPPTICNIYVTQPDLGGIVPSTFVVSGYVDNVQADCYWTVFEANAGAVEVYDNNNNLLTDYIILSSVGDWMQTPSNFQAFVSMLEVPETENGYIRFYEHPAEGVADIFDYPISFSVWSDPIVSPGVGTGSFFGSLADFFRSRDKEPKEDKDTSPGFFDQAEEDVEEIPIPVIVFDSVPVQNQGDNFCEVRKEERLVCYGEYTDEDREVCGCSVFSSLKSLQAQQNLKNYSADLSQATFSKTLFLGDRGVPVENIQGALFVLGYYDQIPSRVYDGKTLKAVRAFQKENDLPGWGLVVGERSNDTLRKLFSN